MFEIEQRDVLRVAARSFAPFQWWQKWYEEGRDFHIEEMMMWVYREREDRPGVWEVGFFDPSGVWHPDGDFDQQCKAAARCRWLNGGSP